MIKLKDILQELIIGDKVQCDNCDWNWKIADGGDDLYMCHKCGHDNTPKLTEQSYGMAGIGSSSMYPSAQAAKSLEKTLSPIVKDATEWIKKNDHLLLDLSALIVSVIPGGMPMAVGLELTNAALYFKKGDKLMGTISTVFAALPIIGSIPGVKQAIGFGLKTGTKYSLTQIKKILEVVVKFKNKIRRQILAIESMIKKFPHLNLDKYLNDLIAGKIDSKTFYKNFKGYNNTMKVVKIDKAMPLQHLSPDPNLTINKLNLTGFLDNIKNLSRPGSFKRKVGKDALNKPGGLYTTNPQTASTFYQPTGKKPYYNFELKSGSRGLNLQSTGEIIVGMSVGNLTKYMNDGFDFIIGKGMLGKPEVIPLNKSVIQNWRRGVPFK